MGIRCLESFIRNEVPYGVVPVNVRNELRNYRTSASSLNLPAQPIIVIDFQSLYEPVCRHDAKGLLCGGRYEFARQLVDRFLKRLRDLGATLVFFNDGPMQSFKKRTMAQRHDERYEAHLRVVNEVDAGENLDKIIQHQIWNIPNNCLYPVKSTAKKYGRFITTFDEECDREIVAYANSTKALAIITDDSDFLIFKGSFRYWSAKGFNFETLSTNEYNRQALIEHLELSYDQMPMLATLGGNDFIRYDEVKSFHEQWGTNPVKKFRALADFVRAPHEDVVLEVFGQVEELPDLRRRFQEGLDFYDTEHLMEPQARSLSAMEDPVLEFLKSQQKVWMHIIWTQSLIPITYDFIDLRSDLGAEYPVLVAELIQRQAAIVLNKSELGENATIRLCLKVSHEEPFADVVYPLQFRPPVTPPSILDLLSEDEETYSNLLETKMLLNCWLISDTLDHHKVQTIPPKLRPTVLALYFLVEHRCIKMFEADLLLQIANDAAFEKYDVFKVRSPARLTGRPFRVTFLFKEICKQILLGLQVLGLENEYPAYPQFDGNRFHQLYRNWRCGVEGLEESLLPWRIYGQFEEI